MNTLNTAPVSGLLDRLFADSVTNDAPILERLTRARGAANGQIVAASSEGYKAKAGAEKAIASIKAHAAKAEVVEVKE